MKREDYRALKTDLETLSLTFEDFVYDTPGCEIIPLTQFEKMKKKWQDVSNEIDKFLDKAERILINQVYADSFFLLGIDHSYYYSSRDVERIVKLDSETITMLPGSEQEIKYRKWRYDYIIPWYPQRMMIVFKEMCQYEDEDNDTDGVSPDIKSSEVQKTEHINPSGVSADNKRFRNDKPYIFVSYSHKNADRVMPLIEELQKNNYNVWYDDAISPASEWLEEIVDKLKNCMVLIFAATNESMASEHCKNELYFASENKKIILPVIFEKELQLPDWFTFQFGRFQRLNCFEQYSPEKVVEQLQSKADWVSNNWLDQVKLT